jgi:sugar O-acyltransferase (sialic acid O-acetyltransferase NeuD family)
MNKLVFIGMGGLGHEILAYARHFGAKQQIIGYYDDVNKNIDIPYLGDLDYLSKGSAEYYLILTIADADLKKKLAIKYKSRRFKSLDYGASFSKDNITGRGSIICPGVMITTNVSIGDFCLVNLNCTIGHNVVIGNYTSVMPGCNISGNVTIGEGVLVGTGAQILQGVKVGDNSKIGAGAVVTKDVKPETTVVGIPAAPKL